MSFIELGGIDEVSELPCAPEGEYDLVVEDADSKVKDDGCTQIRLRISIEGDVKYAGIFHYLTMPGPSDDEEKANNKLLFVKRFLVTFGIAVDGGFDESQLQGARATCMLKQQEYEGNLSNNIVLPRLA